MTNKIIRQYDYCFSFKDGTRETFSVKLSKQSRLISVGATSPPSWTRLDNHQCTPCTLDLKTNSHCPIAVNIADLVSTFTHCPSHKPCTVSCQSPERLVTKDTTVQKGLSSILGLLMATSGCPIMDFLRPLARFHLPFASIEESVFRSVTAYLLRQYFLNDENKKADFELNNIIHHYNVVKQVNRGILDRVRYVGERDADKNAIVTLNSLSQILEMEVETNLESLRHFFVLEGEQ